MLGLLFSLGSVNAESGPESGVWGDRNNTVAVIEGDNYYAYFSWYVIDIVGKEHTFGGQIYHIPFLDAFCGRVYEGELLAMSVINYKAQGGVVCIDFDYEKLLMGYSLLNPVVGCEIDLFTANPRKSIIQRFCSGSNAFTNLKDIR